jgi:hypothetical protein
MTTARSRSPAVRGKGLGGRMTGSIGSFVVRRARLVLVAAMLAVVGFSVLGFGAFGKLKTGGFQDPGAEAASRLAAVPGVSNVVSYWRTRNPGRRPGPGAQHQPIRGSHPGRHTAPSPPLSVLAVGTLAVLPPASALPSAARWSDIRRRCPLPPVPRSARAPACLLPASVPHSPSPACPRS